LANPIGHDAYTTTASVAAYDFLESDVTLELATRNHKTRTVPISTAVAASVAGREFDRWDDPNLEIAITQMAEKIRGDVTVFMAYLELCQDLGEQRIVPISTDTAKWKLSPGNC